MREPARARAAALTAVAEALRFLTTIPLPASTPPWPGGGVDVRRSGESGPGAPAARAAAPSGAPWTTAAFPLVGLVLGGAALPLFWLPADPALRAGLILALWALLTGGLHEDGWCDAVDAWAAPADREARLRILADPRPGALGTVATVLLVLLRFAALASVGPGVVLAAPVVGRGAMVLSLASAPPLREDGLGASLAPRARPGWASGVAGAILVGIALLLGVRDPGLCLLGAALAGRATYALLVRRLGGLNGDGHGAVGLAAETGALVVAGIGW